MSIFSQNARILNTKQLVDLVLDLSRHLDGFSRIVDT